jgi:DNA adenine methylase
MDSVISWVGGKRLLRKKIIPLIPQHEVYCEVFGGAGWVLFGKSPEKAHWMPEGKGTYTEVFNDYNGDLINFWRYLRQHPEAFVAELNTYLVSREAFARVKETTPRTELDRAAIFYYRLACSYGGFSRIFTILQKQHYLPLRSLEKVKEAAERLRHVIIENMDFEKLIGRYDSPTTFFYLDPPYFTKESFYKRDNIEAFDRHGELARVLHGIKGKFILSYNDHEAIRALYSDLRIDTVDAPYTLGQRHSSVPELLIRNF